HRRRRFPVRRLGNAGEVPILLSLRAFVYVKDEVLDIQHPCSPIRTADHSPADISSIPCPLEQASTYQSFMGSVDRIPSSIWNFLLRINFCSTLRSLACRLQPALVIWL